MSPILIYLLYWLATAAGIAVVGLVLIVETFAVLALIGASKNAAAAAEPTVREEPKPIEPARP